MCFQARISPFLIAWLVFVSSQFLQQAAAYLPSKLRMSNLMETVFSSCTKVAVLDLLKNSINFFNKKWVLLTQYHFLDWSWNREIGTFQVRYSSDLLFHLTCCYFYTLCRINTKSTVICSVCVVTLNLCFVICIKELHN